LQRRVAVLAMRAAALALLGLLAIRLRHLWREHPVDFSAANGWLLALAGAVTFAAVVAYGLVWPLILKQLGTRPPPDSVRIFLQSQLGKYVPGSVWQYAGRVGLARNRGIPIRSAILSLAIEVGASAIAAAALGLFVFPLPIAVPLAFAILIAVTIVGAKAGAQRLLEPAMRRVAGIVPLSVSDFQSVYRSLYRATIFYIPVWVVYGLAFWLTGRALFAVPAHDLAFFTATFALGGIGVREAVLVALLAPRIGQREAIVIAAASRLLLTAADLVGGGAAVLLPRRTRGMSAAPLNGGRGE
jgi:hypothetical protein